MPLCPAVAPMPRKSKREKSAPECNTSVKSIAMTAKSMPEDTSDRRNSPDVLTLHLAGAFAARAADNPIEGLSRRGQAMLAYLSQQPGMRAERSRLADLLWSDRSEAQARASLRQELSSQRKLLPPGILQASRQHVWLDPRCVQVRRDGGEEFMCGFDLGSEGFEDWLRQQRAADDAAGSEEDPDPASKQLLARPAVLLCAFEALSPAPEDALFAAGLADDLRTTLCYWRWFPVIGPDAIGWKTPRQIDLRAAMDDLQAGYAITGTLRCAEGRVRISVGLTEAATGRTIWSQTFDGLPDDIFVFQEDVSRAIVAQIEPQIARAEVARIARLRPSSITPWQMLAQADDIDRKGGEGYGTPESNFSQVRLMEKALAIAPDFAPALARIGRIHFRSALLGWVADREAAFAQALDATSRALEIDPDNWEAHGYNGLTRIFGLHDYDGGRFHSFEAVRLNPSAALARHAAGCALEWCGEPEAALEHLNLIFRLNPDYQGRAAALGDITTCEMFVGNRDAAVEAARRLLAIAPGYARGLQRCVATFGYFQETALAAEALGKLRDLMPDFDEGYVRKTYPYVREDDTGILLEGFRRAGAF